MSTLTYLLSAQVKDASKTLNGKILTRPTLLVTDGISIIYACDVDIGLKDPAGNDQVASLIDRYNTVLRNVPVARANYDLLYADVGAAVKLERSLSGQYTITGFSDERPGTYIRIPVDLDELTIGVIEDLTITARPLTLGEFLTYGGFGSVPLGAIAVFEGSTLLRIQ